MSGHFPLDWASLTVSLFNTILLLWLGLTVLLNAERRTWGIWLAGGGLLAGAAFFVSHSILLNHDLTLLSQSLEFWWQAGWTPLIALPYAWYALMLWYTGFWDAARADERRLARRRQRVGWIVATVATAGMAVPLVLSPGLPTYGQMVQLDLAATPTLGQVPLLIAGYPLYALLCIGLALSALAHPAPSPRVMGDLARRRARPWLVATSIALIAASLLVAATMGWIAYQLRQRPAGTWRLSAGIAGFDLAIAACIAGAIVLLGQAIISYEVFTGHNLPRRGFLRHWRRAVILAAGYSSIVGWSLTAELRPIYSLLLTVAVMTTFYAMLVWRTFGDHERALAQLRPFVTSQGLYDDLRQGNRPSEVEAVAIFHALCEEVLGSSLARLIPLGPSAPLAGPPLVYPDGTTASPVPVQALAEQFVPSQRAGVAISPDRYAGAVWAVPLWHEQVLMGVLLLGEKQDGGLYTQEEIEIAQAGGERLIDIQSSAEMARRLMALQRQKLAETQIVDQRTRRTLHDEVLPRLHAALLTLQGDPTSAPQEVTDLLAEIHHRVADLLRDMPTSPAPDVARRGIVAALRRTVDGELDGCFDSVRWEVARDAAVWMQAMPPLTAEVLFYAAREAIRNAAHHGQRSRSERPLELQVAFAVEAPWELAVHIVDNGPGIQPSGGGGAGNGQGLALHSTMMTVVGGTLEVGSAPGTGTHITLGFRG